MGSLCSTAKWKNSESTDLKFDYIDIKEFKSNNGWIKFKYSFVFFVCFKNILIYLTDIWVAILLFIPAFTNGTVTGDLSNNNGNLKNDGFWPPFEYRKYLILASILVSFLILLWDIKKARLVIKSKDISTAFTCNIAYLFYVIKSYSYYCFFNKINNSRKTIDKIAFFVFFRLKGWKRLLLAEAPRQYLNLITLYALLKQYGAVGGPFNYINAMNTMIQEADKIRLITAALLSLTLLLWAGRFLLTVISFFMYIPLLCVIRGNLKEYCCHKIDKRIGQLLNKQTRKRIKQNQDIDNDVNVFPGIRTTSKETRMNYSGNNSNNSFRGPTLPKIDIDLNQSHNDLSQYSLQPISNNPQLDNIIYNLNNLSSIDNYYENSYEYNSNSNSNNSNTTLYHPPAQEYEEPIDSINNNQYQYQANPTIDYQNRFPTIYTNTERATPSPRPNLHIPSTITDHTQILLEPLNSNQTIQPNYQLPVPRRQNFNNNNNNNNNNLEAIYPTMSSSEYLLNNRNNSEFLVEDYQNFNNYRLSITPSYIGQNSPYVDDDEKKFEF